MFIYVLFYTHVTHAITNIFLRDFFLKLRKKYQLNIIIVSKILSVSTSWYAYVYYIVNTVDNLQQLPQTKPYLAKNHHR